MKFAILLALFGLLRISNLAPYAASSFDPDRCTLIENIEIREDALIVHLHWSKTMQLDDEEAKILSFFFGRTK